MTAAVDPTKVLDSSRLRNECRKGHKFTDENTRWIFRTNGGPYRRCKICEKSWWQEYRDRKDERTAVEDQSKTDFSWMERAKCRGADLNDFFAADGEKGIPQRSKAAAARFCHQCPVRSECLESAFKFNDHGLRGGLWHTGNGRTAPLWSEQDEEETDDPAAA